MGLLVFYSIVMEVFYELRIIAECQNAKWCQMDLFLTLFMKQKHCNLDFYLSTVPIGVDFCHII